MLIQTDLMDPKMSGFAAHQTYCGLDTCVTLEVWEELQRIHQGAIPTIYSFSRAMQAPYLAIMQKGMKVDQQARADAASSIRKRMTLLQDNLDLLASAMWDKGLNANSPKQLKEFLYGAMHLPEVWLRFKGESKLSTNREALEKLDQYLYARPFVQSILRLRDLNKQLSIFEMEIDPDGRFRASYNVAGTETGRPSSSENAFGTGGNAQNISPGLRYVFESDPGWKMCVIDLEQVEARDVGYFCGCLFDDWSFLNSCESGDLHTNNAKLIWPERPWTGNPKSDRALADQIFYRDFSFRDMAKRGSHLSNYSGTAWTAARSLKVPIGVMEDFQNRYCRGPSCAYPAIARWWQWTAEQLQTKRFLVTPFGRRRHFFGRANDDATLREAIAFLPQSTTADRMNLGLWRIHKYLPQVQLLAQTYDSVTFQFREEEDENEIISKALDLIRVELLRPDGTPYIVPGEAKVGWNWGSATDPSKPLKPGQRPNPGGLVKWSSKGDKRQRERKQTLLDIRM